MIFLITYIDQFIEVVTGVPLYVNTSGYLSTYLVITVISTDKINAGNYG